MAMDSFISEKLESIKRTFDALTERLSDPDIMNDRARALPIFREKASIEPTVETYVLWKRLESERIALTELDQSGSIDADLRELTRDEIKEINAKQIELQDKIKVMLLPRDPNDDRNVMLEVRSGTGGDEAGIWAKDLVNIYRKYSESLGWKVLSVSESEGDKGGYKTCVLQITGNYVYSKLKYEVYKYATLHFLQF